MENKSIEMLGLPCTGKTTYLVRKKIQIIKVDDYSNLRRIIGIIIEIISSPILTIDILKLFFNMKTKYAKPHIIGVFRFFSRLYEYRLKKNQSGVFEEGIIQALWGLFLYVEDSSWSISILNRIISNVRTPSLHIVYISCSKKELLLRNANRIKKTRFSKLIECGEDLDVRRSRRWMSLILVALRKDKFHIKYLSSYK